MATPLARGQPRSLCPCSGPGCGSVTETHFTSALSFISYNRSDPSVNIRRKKATEHGGETGTQSGGREIFSQWKIRQTTWEKSGRGGSGQLTEGIPGSAPPGQAARCKCRPKHSGGLVSLRHPGRSVNGCITRGWQGARQRAHSGAPSCRRAVAHNLPGRSLLMPVLPLEMNSKTSTLV